MSGGPRNAVTDDNGFRIYAFHPAPESIPWLEAHGLPTDDVRVLSVTSIRRACGETFNLVNWQIANILDVLTGMEKATIVGPRGGVSEKRVSTEWPPVMLIKLFATEGAEAKLMKFRAEWKDLANQPRDRAGARGTIVHECIELDVKPELIDVDYVTAARNRLDARDRNKMKTVTEQDVRFVERCVAWYWNMRRKHPFVILAREPQVWNLSVGYSGSADALFWFLPEGTTREQLVGWRKLARQGLVSMEDIEGVGGEVVLGDWKTSKDVHTDHVIQVTAYMSAEFIATDGVIDERLTAIIRAAHKAALVNVRPNGWGIHEIAFRDDVLLAFLGSVQLARLLVTYQQPDKLFTISWKSEGTKP